MGDIVKWHARYVTVTDIAKLHASATYVVVEFLDGKHLPVSLPVEALCGSEVWHRADSPIDLRRLDVGQPGES
ncbi:MAG: hypothetical protein ACYDEN_06975 [Acidimicrobiales bacterium]